MKRLPEASFNGLYTAEVIHRLGPWRSFEAVEFATLEWVDWFNHRRPLDPIGNIPPTEAEDRYDAFSNSQPGLRDSNQIASGKPGTVQPVVPAYSREPRRVEPRGQLPASGRDRE